MSGRCLKKTTRTVELFSFIMYQLKDLDPKLKKNTVWASVKGLNRDKQTTRA